MTNKQAAMLETMRLVERFLQEYREMLGPIADTVGGKVVEVIARLGEHAAAQALGIRQTQIEVARQGALRRTLWFGCMRPLALTARMVPGLDRLRISRWQAPLRLLLTEARGLGEVAEPHVAELVAQGLPADCVVQMRAVVEALEGSIAALRVDAMERVTATAGLEVEARRGALLLRVIDSRVRGLLAGEPGLLAEWRVVSRADRQLRRAA